MQIVIELRMNVPHIFLQFLINSITYKNYLKQNQNNKGDIVQKS